MQHKDELQVITEIEANRLQLVFKVHNTVIQQLQALHRVTIMVVVAVTKADLTCMEVSKIPCKECLLHLHLIIMEIR